MPTTMMASRIRRIFFRMVYRLVCVKDKYYFNIGLGNVDFGFGYYFGSVVGNYG
jgi:hypothetical protein